MASRVKAFPRRQTNSVSTLPRPAHLEGAVTRSHQCLHLALAKCSGITRHTTNPPGFVPLACRPPPTSVPPHQTHHSHDQLHTCTNCVKLVYLVTTRSSSASDIILRRLWQYNIIYNNYGQVSSLCSFQSDLIFCHVHPCNNKKHYNKFQTTSGPGVGSQWFSSTTSVYRFLNNCNIYAIVSKKSTPQYG